MAAIHFESSLDNSKLIAGVNQANKTVDQFVSNVQNQGAKIDNTFRNMAASAGAYFSLQFGANLVKEIINVRGEFQQLGIAFETMLGSKEKADQLMSEAVSFAQKTPFTLTDVATNIKQLMAMGIATEDVMSTMKSLGDVAAGVSVPIARVAINYGQVATLGKLQGRELRDFAMAGIPLIDELAKNLGRAKDEIDDMVSAGKIGFKDVEKAFQTMAGEGGKFFNLMEKQNASVTGQISNLTDKWQVMLNEIGKGNEGLIYSGISGLAGVISSYEEILNILKVIVATYGAYRAALIAVSIAQSYQTAAAAAQVFTMTGVLTKLTFAQYASAKAQAVLNGVMAINPYVAAAMALAAIGSALYLFTTHVSDAEKAQIALNESMNEEKVKIDSLVSTIKNINAARAEQIKAERELNKLMPEGTIYLNAQSLATDNGTKAIRKYIEAVRNKMELDKLQQDLVKNLNEQDRIARGDMSFGENLKLLALGASDPSHASEAKNAQDAYKSKLIFDLKEEAEAIAKRTQEIISGTNAEKESGKVELTVAQQIINATNSKKEAESQLNEMRMAGSKSSKKAIEEQVATIDEYKKTIAILTGIDDKAIKKANDDTKKNLDDLKEIFDKSENDILINQKNTREKNVADDIKAENDEIKRAEKKQETEDQIYIDGIKARKAEDDRETEDKKDKAIKAKKLDEEKKERQKEYYQQGLQFLDNMMMKYGEQLGMTEEQAGLISSLAKGDYFAAAFNAFGIISDMFKESKDNISDFYTSLNDQTKKLIENIDLINESLSNVGTGSSLISFDILSAELLKLKNDSARLNEQLLITGSGEGRRGGTTTQGAETTGTRDDGENRARTILDLSKQTAELYAEIEKLTSKLQNPNLTEDQRAAIVALLNTYNDILNSIEQSVEDITGSTIQDLSRSLTDAFLSGEDAAVKWGQTVNDIIKNVIARQLTSELLTKPITEAINTLIGDTSEGLTPTEAQKFKDTIDALYTSVAPAYQEAIDALNKVGIDISGTGKDNKNTLTGQIKGISEDTASLINGRLMKINVDMDRSYMLGLDQLDIMSGSAGNLLKIEKNTFNTVQQLIVSNGELVKMNATLNAKL